MSTRKKDNSRYRVSLVVASSGESNKLDACLSSAADLVSEIIIFNLQVKDKKLYEIANKFSAKVVDHKPVEYVELIRDEMIKSATHEWVLILDPDEAVNSALFARLKKFAIEGVSAVNIPRKNIFFGKWISHTNWWPDRHMRFFMKDKVVWPEVIHSYPQISGPIVDLPASEELAINHYGYKSFNEFIDRQNRYSGIEARNRLESGEKFSWLNFFWWPTREFLARYIKHAGFLDGFYGFSLTYLMMAYKVMVLVKIWERNK